MNGEFAPRVPHYGMGKIQRLPFSLWRDLAKIQTEAEMADFIGQHINLLPSGIGDAGLRKAIRLRRMPASLFSHLYHRLSSGIHRAGGSQAMDWTSYVLDASKETAITKTEVWTGDADHELRISDCLRSFPMAPFFLRIGGGLSDSIVSSAISVVDLLGAEFYRHSAMFHHLQDFEELFDAAANNHARLGSSFWQTETRSHPAKLCTKVDYTFSIQSNASGSGQLVPIVIDINDLHGGLQWIDDFREHYRNLCNDTLLAAPAQSIVTTFVGEYVSAYSNLHSQPPKRVLICLSEKARWDADNGHNYKCIAAEFHRQINSLGVTATVGMTYMSEYIRALRDSDGTPPVFRLIDSRGLLSDLTLTEIDLVVRNYRKIPQQNGESGYTFSDQLLPATSSNIFTILEDERLRVVFDKRFIRTIADAGELPGHVVIPARVGTYRLHTPVDDLTGTIIAHAAAQGISEIVIKLADKSVSDQVSALFYDLRNSRHVDLLEKALLHMQLKVADVDHLVVDAMIGDPVVDDRKVEVRTLVFARR